MSYLLQIANPETPQTPMFEEIEQKDFHEWKELQEVVYLLQSQGRSQMKELMERRMLDTELENFISRMYEEAVLIGLIYRVNEFLRRPGFIDHASWPGTSTRNADHVLESP